MPNEVSVDPFIVSAAAEPAEMEAAESGASYSVELGEVFFRSGNFRKSLPHLERSLRYFLKRRDSHSYLSCYTMLITACHEMEETERLAELKERFEKDCKKISLKKSARILAISAYYSFFAGDNHQKAFKKAKEALDMALDEHAISVKEQDYLREIHAKLDVALCLFVYIHYHYMIEDYKRCAAELVNLKVLLDYYFNLKQDLQLRRSKTDNAQEQHLFHKMLEAVKKNFQFMQRIKLNVMFIEAYVEGSGLKKDYAGSDKILWECYEEANKTDNTHIIPYLFCYMSYNYYLKNELEQACVFLSLAEKNADPDRRLFFKCLEKFKKETGLAGGGGETGEYDIIFYEENHSVVEKRKGCINFKNQFILLDVLKHLMLSPGVPHSKQFLVEKIWREEYSPATHDNKIYVTIKRLRELLEPDVSKPRYICRGSGGYYLSKKLRRSLNNQLAVLAGLM